MKRLRAAFWRWFTRPAKHDSVSLIAEDMVQLHNKGREK